MTEPDPPRILRASYHRRGKFSVGGIGQRPACPMFRHTRPYNSSLYWWPGKTCVMQFIHSVDFVMNSGDLGYFYSAHDILVGGSIRQLPLMMKRTCSSRWTNACLAGPLSLITALRFRILVRLHFNGFVSVSLFGRGAAGLNSSAISSPIIARRDCCPS